MAILQWHVATLFITALYYCWRQRREVQCRKDRVLRDRVTYLMWVAANHGM
jgi:hypothetical protein